MLKSGIADTYRYEQFLKKPDFIYNFDYFINNVNLNALNKEKISEKLIYLEFLMILSIYNTSTAALKFYNVKNILS
jgi:hypothetical protein